MQVIRLFPANTPHVFQVETTWKHGVLVGFLFLVFKFNYVCFINLQKSGLSLKMNTTQIISTSNTLLNRIFYSSFSGT